MMRSMYAGVSGLRIHQTKMDVIGNNIANVNTIGFKSSRVTFSEVFSQTVQSASAANESTGGRNPMQIGLGSSISSIDVNMTEGAAQRTDNQLDLKIEGSGFFVVSNATGNSFTRAGAFKLDQAGNLVTPEGLNVMGWQPDGDGNIVKDKVSKLKILDADSMYIEPDITEKMTFSGNINMNDTQLPASEGGSPFTTSFYDSMGYKYTASFSVQSTTNPNEYLITLEDITTEDGLSFNDATATAYTMPTKSMTVSFDAGGKVSGGTGDIYTDADGNVSMDLSGITTTFSTIQGDGSGSTDPLTVDFSGLTLFSGNTTIAGAPGDEDGLGSGSKAGSLSGYEIGGDGTILGRYSNGKTKTLGQVVIANFDNPAGLAKTGNNLYQTTANSGEFDGVGQDITSSGGNFNAGVLEMSNVDLSSEFTEMITTQRGFQANSKIITTSDELLQELVNLKR